MSKVKHLKNKIYWAWGDQVPNKIDTRHRKFFVFWSFATRVFYFWTYFLNCETLETPEWMQSNVFRLLKFRDACFLLMNLFSELWNSWNARKTSTPKGGYHWQCVQPLWEQRAGPRMRRKVMLCMLWFDEDSKLEMQCMLWSSMSGDSN